MRNSRRFLLVIVVLGAAGFAAYKKLQGPEVEVARVQAGPLEHSIVVSGRVQAPNRIEIGAVITGRVLDEKTLSIATLVSTLRILNNLSPCPYFKHN